MNVCTDKAIDWMIHCDVINESERKLYEYAMYSAILHIVPLVLAGIIGFFFGNMLQGICMVLPFMILRKYSGGFHSKHLRSCLIGSSLLLTLCIFLCTRLNSSVMMFWITSIAAVSLVQVSPIENSNRVLDSREKQYYKQIVKRCVITFLVVIVILVQMKQSSYAVCFSIGIQLTAVLQIPCLFQKKYQKKL